MGEKIIRMILCDECHAENWGLVSQWLEREIASTRSGKLKVRAWCRFCEVEMPAGTSAEAITIHHGLGEASGWEDGYLTAQDKRDHGEQADPGVRMSK